MVKALWHRTIIRNGRHNAFTDLCFWRGAYWLTFRLGSAHVSPDGEVVVMRSTNLEEWSQVVILKTRGDDRDPKFCPIENRLYVYFGTWLPKPEGWPDKDFGPLVTHVCFTDDGTQWSKPIEAYEWNHWLWRVRFHDRVFYAAAYGWNIPTVKSKSFLDLLISQDGLKWRKLSSIAGENDQPDETDLFFQPSSELWCIARSARVPDHSLFYWSKPPYRHWEGVDLKITVHCPVFCESNRQLYVAGRRQTDAPWRPQPTPAGNTGIFAVQKNKVEPVFALSSDGDAAYPGLISREPGRLIISYYSQHAYLSGVVKALAPYPSDVFMAEIAIE